MGPSWPWAHGPKAEDSKPLGHQRRLGLWWQMTLHESSHVNDGLHVVYRMFG